MRKRTEQLVVKQDDSWAKVDRYMRLTLVFLTISVVATITAVGIRIVQLLGS